MVKHSTTSPSIGKQLDLGKEGEERQQHHPRSARLLFGRGWDLRGALPGFGVPKAFAYCPRPSIYPALHGAGLYSEHRVSLLQGRAGPITQTKPPDKSVRVPPLAALQALGPVLSTVTPWHRSWVVTGHSGDGSSPVAREDCTALMDESASFGYRRGQVNKAGKVAIGQLPHLQQGSPGVSG